MKPVCLILYISVKCCTPVTIVYRQLAAGMVVICEWKDVFHISYVQSFHLSSFSDEMIGIMEFKKRVPLYHIIKCLNKESARRWQQWYSALVVHYGGNLLTVPTPTTCWSLFQNLPTLSAAQPKTTASYWRNAVHFYKHVIKKSIYLCVVYYQTIGNNVIFWDYFQLWMNTHLVC